MADTNQQDTEVLAEKFLQDMQQHYEADFVHKLTEISNGAIDENQAKNYFQDFANSLYRNPILGLSKGYGVPTEQREKLIETFHQEVLELITSLGAVAAQGQTFLWSNPGIGMFAAAEEEIRKAAGVLGPGQSLEQMQIGKLWGKLEIIQNPKERLNLNWDRMSQAWNAISKEFAANAVEDVHVFLPKGIGALSIFWNVELPELRKRMSPFTDSPLVKSITIHHPSDEILPQLQEIDQNKDLDAKTKETQKRSLMTLSHNWESEDIVNASFEMKTLSPEEKAALFSSKTDPWSFLLIEIMMQQRQKQNSALLNHGIIGVDTNKGKQGNSGTIANQNSQTIPDLSNPHKPITVGKVAEAGNKWNAKAKLLSEQRADFLRKMQERYEADFVKQLLEISNGAIDENQAQKHFQDFANSLYQKRVPNSIKGYSSSSQLRQNLVDNFAPDVSQVITALRTSAAQDPNFLWSNVQINRFIPAVGGTIKTNDAVHHGQSSGQNHVAQSPRESLKVPKTLKKLIIKKAKKIRNGLKAAISKILSKSSRSGSNQVAPQKTTTNH